MKSISIALAFCFTLSIGLYAAQQDRSRLRSNPLIDYPSFLEIAQRTESIREKSRLTEVQFMSLAKAKGTIVLDARSADKYAMRHIEGALNLPFTDFTVESLARVIPTKTTRILIYCNNNFSGSPSAFASKCAPAALNISTFISLATYGYENVFELAPLLDVKTSRLKFAGSEVNPPSHADDRAQPVK